MEIRGYEYEVLSSEMAKFPQCSGIKHTEDIAAWRYNGVRSQPIPFAPSSSCITREMGMHALSHVCLAYWADIEYQISTF